MNRKLVRDFIPEIAKTSGSDLVFKQYETDVEFIRGLSDKIVEETDEVLNELKNNVVTIAEQELLPILEEFGDLLEVLDCCNDIVGIESTHEILRVINIDPAALNNKYEVYSNNDFIQALNTSKYALKYTFLFETAEYEQVVYNTCSIILGFINIYGLMIDDLKETQYTKYITRGGFESRWYLEL